MSLSRFRRLAASSRLTSKSTEDLRVCTVRPSVAAWRKSSPTTMAWVSVSDAATHGTTSTARRHPSRALASVGSALGDHSTTTSSRPRRLILSGVLTLTPETSALGACFAPPASSAANLTTYASDAARSRGTRYLRRTSPSAPARTRSATTRHQRPLQLRPSAIETTNASPARSIPTSALSVTSAPCSRTSPDFGLSTRIPRRNPVKEDGRRPHDVAKGRKLTSSEDAAQRSPASISSHPWVDST